MYSKRKAKRRYEKLYSGENKKFWIRMKPYLNKENSHFVMMPERWSETIFPTEIVSSDTLIAFQELEERVHTVFHEALAMQRSELVEDPCNENTKLSGLEADSIDVVERRKRMYKSVAYGAVSDIPTPLFTKEAESKSFKMVTERKLKFDWSSLE